MPIPVPGPVPQQEPTEIAELGTVAKDFFDFMMSSELQSRLVLFKVVFILILIGFIVALIYLASTTSYAQWRVTDSWYNFLFPHLKKSSKASRKWKKITKSLSKGKLENQWKVAVLEGINFVHKYMPQDEFDELTTDDVDDLGEFLEAERTARTIREDMSYRLDKHEAGKLLDIFEKALIDLQVLS